MSAAIYSLPFVRDLVASATGNKDIFYNLSWTSVPLSLLIAALPHWYTIYLAESNKVQGGWSNVNPRFWVQSLIAKGQKEKLSPLELTILRGQSCQANGFENVPLFVATVIWANYTGLDVNTINRFVVGWLASRAIYSVLYLKTTGYANSFARTAVFQFGIAYIITVFIKGAFKIAPTLK
ncbi:Membrane-associated, eicosanoid/glutathione metabolism (MAPEG) protein [Kalmanozyma brasiliensis GHG001]|uniref:Uncharacterized protein n=1 Tax=Kalmanozyma brasiliensis (strain GHG001) TaxID=1365824 RepID=V5EJC1_KALBG|nr:Membrane-associated, eicosanoid/glutathione metabolism (MAPEG) protein [Kalmanozyma brasiliensis GHG001]EST04840.1 Membrane-associated, eicosanoid/glutathione metabolism (MAPEG) protein [Kalmanozyma brasiliensis GHG001]